MAPSVPSDVTRLLADLSAGDEDALGKLVPLVYDELRTLAGRAMRRERRAGSLGTTALVHEAYLRLVDQRDVKWQHRAQFFGVAAQMMRRILVDHARRQRTFKRGGDRDQVSFDVSLTPAPERTVDVLALDEALSALSQFDAQQGRIVELRFFGGLTIEETAEVCGVSPATVKRDWTVAKAWLRREMLRDKGDP